MNFYQIWTHKLIHFCKVLAPLKEGNVLFNDALNTFYLRLYGVGHMAKNQSDSKRGNPLPPHGLLFPISSIGSFICTIQQRIAHNMAFGTPVVEHWLERETAQWVHAMEDRSDDPSHNERTLLPRSYISLRSRLWMHCVWVSLHILLADEIAQRVHHGGSIR